MPNARALSGLIVGSNRREFKMESSASREIEGTSVSQIANLASMIFFKEECGRIIGITAPIAGEGVTTISCLLARELARTDRFRSVLLATHDLESLQLRDLDEFESLWSRSPIHGYWERKGLQRDSEPSKGPWRTDLGFRSQVIAALRRQFDNVVIDCPPVTNSGDIAMMASLIDGFVLVVRSGGSTHTQVQQAIRLVQLAAGEIKGCCFNRRTYPIPSRLYRLFGR